MLQQVDQGGRQQRHDLFGVRHAVDLNNHAADVDGAVGVSRFACVTFPLLGNLYLICTLLSTLWLIGDFTTVFFVSGGAPARTTEVLATYGTHLAFDSGDPPLGSAAMLSILPLLIPLAILLIRRLRSREVQL